MKDIVPELLEKLKKDFTERFAKNVNIKALIGKIDNGQANYQDANAFALEVGVLLRDVFQDHLSAEVLPDGKMYYNIADRVLNETLGQNYNLVSDYAKDTQTILNKQAGISFQGVKPEKNQSRIDGIVERVSAEDDFETIKWILGEPVVNFTQSVVDDCVKTNVEFHYKLGLRPKIVRKEAGNCCDWCKQVVGTYEYPDEVPDEVYKRHRYCKCTVEYNPGDGRRQDIWSKKWIDPEKDDKIEKRIEYSEKFTGASGAKNYFRDESLDRYKSKEDIKKDTHAYLMYDEIKNSNQKITKRKIFNNIGQFDNMKDFTKDDVDIAFDHVFNNLHDLEEGRVLFRPDYDMAQSWNRLINNSNIQEHDLILLRHERLEHDYMYKNGLPYQEAHDKTSEIYFYKVPKK